MKAFSDAVYAEATSSLPVEVAEHYVFNGALNLSWMGLARYHHKRASVVANG